MSAASAHPPVRAVIFDLDGTLVQTRIASWEIFEKISKQFDLGVDRPEQYFDLFRGNVFESIRTLCRDDAHAAQVKEAFLELLRSDYTPPLVPGVTDVVRRLAGECTLAVMSSNAMEVLRRVLVTNDLAFCFAHVFGGDVAPDKRAAIRAFLADSGSGFGRRCEADYDEGGQRQNPEPSSTVLITDTAGDVSDAIEAGIRVVGVAWGMHTVEELTAAGAEFVALWPQEIAAYLLGDAASLSPGGACAVPRTPTKASDLSGCAAATAAELAGAGRDTVTDAVRAAGAVRRNRRRGDPSSGSGPGPARILGTAAEAPDSRRLPEPEATRENDELLVAVTRVCSRG